MTVSRRDDRRAPQPGQEVADDAKDREQDHHALPAAFADGGDPYSLHDLLSGLSPVDHDGAVAVPADEALLLTEVALPDAPEVHAWTAEVVDAALPPEPPAEAEEEAPLSAFAVLDSGDIIEPMPAPLPVDGDAEDDAWVADLDNVVQLLHQLAPAMAEENAPREAATVADDAPAEDEDEDETTAALANLVAMLQETTATPQADDLPAPPDTPEPQRADAGDADEADQTTQALADLVAALQETVAAAAPQDVDSSAGDEFSALTGDNDIAPAPAESEAESEAEGDDVLVLTDELTPPAETPPEGDAAPMAQEGQPIPAAPVGEGEWDASAFALGNIIDALRGLAEEAPPPDTAPEDTAENDAPEEPAASDLAGAEVAAEGIEPVAVEDAEPATEEAEIDETQALTATVDAIIAAHCPPGHTPEMRGDPALPQRLDALASLLADPPPPSDFVALDALYACWSKNTHDSPSRALLATAQNLSRNFGLPGKLPMASSKAWRMLSPVMFETELAQRLTDIGTFIANWQKTQRTFLILEFGEIELIEYLFEALHPGYHADLLAGVMNFKVLSNRRMGLLRRIPNRLKKQITPMLPDNKEAALILLAHAKALLERIADPSGFAPIVDTAGKMQEEIQKMMKAVANVGAPPPVPPPNGGGGMPLGRIG
jgi:hypothetical protein